MKKILWILTVLVLAGVGFFFLFRTEVYRNGMQDIAQVFKSAGLYVLGNDQGVVQKKLPADAGYVDIALSEKLDAATVTKKTVKIAPLIDGDVSVVSDNTIRYTFNEKPSIGSQYTITLASDIQSSNGSKMDKDYLVEMEISAAPRVIKITPEGSLEDLSQHLVVFFNVPLVPVESLTSKDTLPCPLTIQPKLAGTCHRITSSALEFVPDTHFVGSTVYTATVADPDASGGLLYPIKESKSVTITTPLLSLYTANRFDPQQGIPLSFNFSVDQKQLEQRLTLSENGVKLPAKISSVSGSKSQFLITTSSKFFYDHSYQIDISEGLSSIEGNVSMKAFMQIVSAYNFLQNISVHKNIYDDSGAILETRGYRQANEEGIVIPNKEVFFNLSFEQEAPLNKAYFSFVSSNGKKADFDIIYNQKEIVETDGSTHTGVDKKSIRLSIKGELASDTAYTLTVNTSISPAMDRDITYQYRTAPQLKIVDFKFLAYNKSCLYVNNELPYTVYENARKEITASPTAHIVTITPGNQEYYDNNGNRVKETDCPEAKDKSLLYTVSTRLNPNSKYTLSVNETLKDIFDTPLAKATRYEVKTKGIQAKDQYLYTSLNKYRNIIPDNVPIVINMQTINLDKVPVEMCQMGLDGYLAFAANMQAGFPTPELCTNHVVKNLAVKNNHRAMTNNRFDVDEDISQEKVKDRFVYVRGTATSFDQFNRQEGSKEFSSLYIKTNLSLARERGENKNLLFATSLDGLTKMKDLTLSFYRLNYESRTYEPISVSYTVDKNGVYSFANENIQLIVAQNDNYFGIIDTSTDELSNYQFNYIAGQDTSEQEYLYLYTDRPLYKPGDTLYFKGLLRHFSFDGYKKSSITKGTLKIKDINGEVIKSISITLDKNANFDGSVILPKEMPLGEFSFFLVPKLGNQAAEETAEIPTNAVFYIEEYKKPTFKINLDVDKKDALIGEKATVNIQPVYYFGGMMTNTKGTYNVVSQNYFFNAKDYGDYQFGNGSDYFDCLYRDACNYYDSPMYAGTFKVDEQGKAKFEYTFPVQDMSPLPMGEKIYSFDVSVTDPDTQRTVNKTVSTLVHTTDAYVGLKVPYRSTKKDGIKFQGIALDRNAKPKAGLKALVQIIKQERQSVKQQGLNGVFYDNYTLKETLENSYVLNSDNKGAFDKQIKTAGAGEYMIKVIYTGANGQSFVSSQNVYVESDEYVMRNNGNNSITDLIADKLITKVGETQSYVLKSPVKAGSIFIVIEKDDGILDYFVRPLTSFAEKIDIPVKDSYYPNFYVKVYLIGSEDKNPLPIYKRALAVTKVDTEYKRINVAITTDKKNYLPGEKIGLTISVTDTAGKGVAKANGSVAIVDESLLALKGNPQKNPYAFFYDMKRYLGVFSFGSLANLIEKLEIKDASNGSKGGDGPLLKGGNAKKKRGTFKDTAFRLANFTTDANGKVSITSDALPDNLTTWNIEVLANTPISNKLGVGSTTVITNKELMISENLPSFFVSKDQITLNPSIFNKTDKDGTFTITLAATNAEVTTTTQKLTIKKGESQTTPFVLTLHDIGLNPEQKNIVSKITIKAVSSDGKYQDEIEKFVPIKASSLLEYTTTAGKTDAVSFDEHINIGDVRNNGGLLKINYGATLFSSLLDGMNYLSEYPYGCLEQKTSAIHPYALTKLLYTAMGKEYNLKKIMIKERVDADEGYQDISVDEYIKNYLTDLQTFQKNDGGFVFRPENKENRYADFWLTVTLLDALADFQNAGYTPNNKMLKQAIAYTQKRFYLNKYEDCSMGIYEDCSYPDALRLQAIHALTRIDPNNYESYKMRTTMKFKEENSALDLMKLKTIAGLLQIPSIGGSASSLQSDAKKLTDNILNQQVVITPKEAYLGRSAYASRISQSADFIYALSILGKQNTADTAPIIDNMNRRLITQKKQGSFGSTQENIAVIKAITAYLKDSGEVKNANMKANLKVNSMQIAEQKITSDNALDTFSITLPFSKLQSENIFNIVKEGKGTIYYDLNLGYYLPTASIPSRDEGFAVQRIYYKYDDYKKIQGLKAQETQDYRNYKISYDQLKYPKSTFAYLTPAKDIKVGDVLIAYNQIITSEARDKVAFEGFIPGGTELINPNLSTSIKTTNNIEDLNNQNMEGYGYGYDGGYGENGEYQSSRVYSEAIKIGGENIFSKIEYRTDRFFAYTDLLQPGVHEFSYLLKVTYAGTFNLRPSNMSQFYTPEVFGRTAGEVITIK